MATDEAIFRVMALGSTPPTLRFYGWRPAAVSLGYFQNVERECNLEGCRCGAIDVVRRPTGGKAVLHEDDLSYALAARSDERPFPSDIQGTYRVIGRCLREGLRRLGIDARPAGDDRSRSGEIPASCFARPARDELLIDGRKICGSAQARSRGAFLQHGSLLIRFDAERTLRCLVADEGVRERVHPILNRAVTAVAEHLTVPPSPEAMAGVLAEGFAAILHADYRPGDLTPEEEALKTRLWREKYRNDAWNREGRGG